MFRTLGGKRAQLLLSCNIALCCVLLVAQLNVAFTLKPTAVSNELHLRSTQRRLQAANAAAAAAAELCDGTIHRDLCVSTVSSMPELHTMSATDVVQETINQTAAAVRASSNNCSTYLISNRRRIDPRQRIALADCLELFDRTLESLRSAYAGLKSGDGSNSSVDDVRTTLSAAMTNQYTCLDGFAFVPGGGYRRAIERRLRRVSRLVSNSLAMLRKVQRRKRRQATEAFEGYGHVDGFPEWVAGEDRVLLQAPAGVKADLVVAKDGSGNFTTITEAVAAAPSNRKTRYVIYVKGGAYYENVEVGKEKTKLMLIGDGIGKTLVKGNRNVVDGWTTFRSATFAAVGNGFLMRGITVENYAGPGKQQAVALRVSSDLSAFYKCSFVGYQDTLYSHSMRQFLRECDVYGTVDFIFGNSAVVLQKCNLYARVPLPGQKNVYTAQGREDPNQNTGISILESKVAAASDLIPVQQSIPTYLGRPWKQYSRTVYMRSYLDVLIQPRGWLEWDGSFALATLYYGEYMNRGPGSSTVNRVRWPGFRVINNSAEAGGFTAGAFVQGGKWLSATSFPFYLGMSA